MRLSRTDAASIVALAGVRLILIRGNQIAFVNNWRGKRPATDHAREAARTVELHTWQKRTTRGDNRWMNRPGWIEVHMIFDPAEDCADNF